MVEKGRLPMICPSCNKKLDGHMTTEGKMDNPRKGDICLCFYCHEVLECQGDAKLKKINVDDIPHEENRTAIKTALFMVKHRVK